MDVLGQHPPSITRKMGNSLHTPTPISLPIAPSLIPSLMPGWRGFKETLRLDFALEAVGLSQVMPRSRLLQLPHLDLFSF